ncbi:hypothetical protein ACFL50_07030, partial [Candidatus Latescibacterota bacterium]
VFDYVDLQDEKKAYCSCSCAEEDCVEDVRRLYDDELKNLIEKEGHDIIGETCCHCGAVLDCCGDGEKSIQQINSPLYSDTSA